MTARATGMSMARSQWSFDARSDGVLVLRLSGRWLMHDHLPPRAAIEHELGARPAARALAFDTLSVDDWDSGFVAFVRQALDVGRELHLDADVSGLPAGVRKLPDLAAAGIRA
jgi:phospholipid/cholesterol/gamma-HCH transport system permease protein